MVKAAYCVSCKPGYSPLDTDARKDPYFKAGTTDTMPDPTIT